MTPRRRYAIETRVPSAHTKSGWTKWEHWHVAKTREDAEAEAEALGWWWEFFKGEFRIVDREA